MPPFSFYASFMYSLARSLSATPSRGSCALRTCVCKPVLQNVTTESSDPVLTKDFLDPHQKQNSENTPSSSKNRPVRKHLLSSPPFPTRALPVPVTTEQTDTLPETPCGRHVALSCSHRSHTFRQVSGDFLWLFSLDKKFIEKFSFSKIVKDPSPCSSHFRYLLEKYRIEKCFPLAVIKTLNTEEYLGY